MQEFITFAEQLAEASGKIIRQYFRQPIAIDHKTDETPVTIADKKSEEIMREMIMKTFPEHGILGEEFDDYNPDAEFQWVLDPIDGTNNFISGNTLFGTLIALKKRERPLLGVINQPITREFLLGVGGKTLLNGQPVQVRNCQRIEDATLLITGHWLAHDYQDGALVDALSRRVKLYRTWGDCSGYYSLATGFADIMLDPTLNPWDIMALIPIIEGAGGKITDWQGNDAVKGNSIIATAGPLHDEIVRLLNP